MILFSWLPDSEGSYKHSACMDGGGRARGFQNKNSQRSFGSLGEEENTPAIVNLFKLIILDLFQLFDPAAT